MVIGEVLRGVLEQRGLVALRQHLSIAEREEHVALAVEGDLAAVVASPSRDRLEELLDVAQPVVLEPRADERGIFTDISRLKHTERELLSYQERLRSLALEMSMVERERRYITIELQDNLGRSLSYCWEKLSELQKIASSPDIKASLHEISTLVEKSIHYTKTLTYEFSTQILYEKGLEAALKWLGNHFQGLHALTFHFEDDMRPKPLSDETNILLYQAVRELFMNIIRHAHAKNVTTSFERDYKNIRIQVNDDGIGFDTAKIDSFISKKEMFVFSIYERLKYLGGQVQVESAPDGVPVLP